MRQGMPLPKGNQMKVRRVVTRSGRRFRGKYPSQKLGRMVEWESFLERDAFLLFEYHPEVVSYQEQPSREIYYDLQGVQRSYVVDIRATLRSGEIRNYEVKPTEFISKAHTAEKFRCIAQRFEELERSFRILTELDIRRQPLHNNLNLLDEHARRKTQVTPEASLFQLGEGWQWTLGEVCKKLNSRSAVFDLLRTGDLRCDLESELTDHTPTWLACQTGGTHDPFLL